MAADVVDSVVTSTGRRWLDHVQLPVGSPLQVRRAYDRSLHRLVRDAETDLRPHAVIYSLVRTAPYMRGRKAPAVVDFCDALSLQFQRRAAQEQELPRKILFASEAKLLRRFEGRVAADADGSIITTPRDAEELRGIPEVVPVCYDLPEPVWSTAPEASLESGGHPRIVFNGDMSTRYSEVAVQWFVGKVLPLIRRAEPTAEFLIVGRNPTDAIQRAATEPGVRVTGSVRVVRPYLESADVAVVPLLVGTGIKGKMLEAFAAGTPVVATSIADEGMGAAQAGAISVADEPAEFADLVLRLARDHSLRDTQVAQATAFADQRYGVHAVTRQLIDVVERARTAYADRTIVRST
jgi:glycosyltransferase involved in cell wall biosynthesis